MNTTLDNRMLTTVCDTQKLCSYLHVFSSVMRSYQFSMNNAINRYMHIRRHKPHVTTITTTYLHPLLDHIRNIF